MNIFNEFREVLVKQIRGLASEGAIDDPVDLSRVAVEPPRDPAHGDLSTNAAMVLAKQVQEKPRDLAEKIAAKLREVENVTEVEVAGPGFINIRMRMEYWLEQLPHILKAGESYGDSGLGQGRRINVEYVSANPTGVLHMGHARGAIVGDALSSLLQKAGFEVTREYYINDAGGQIDILAESFLKRLAQLQGEVIPDSDFEGLYPGQEIVEAAETVLENEVSVPDGVDERMDWARSYAVDAMMQRIKSDLAGLGIEHDLFSSERALKEAGAVDEVLTGLEEKGLIYSGVLEPPKGKLPDDWEERPQTLFRASNFGDDTDRPLKKSDGSWTYFATDIAYHLDKYKRGFNTMIDVWGADHGGYIKRMKAAVDATTEGNAELDVKICQLVNLLDHGEQVKMSKRAGTVVPVSEVVNGVGKDIIRFIMLTRKNDAPLDFDFAKVTEQSKDNPVFYVQYCHARTCSVIRQAKEVFPDQNFEDSILANIQCDLLTDEGELGLIKRIVTWPRIIESAAETHEPHRLAFYLYDTAADFHAYWNKGRENPDLRFVIEGELELTMARLALVRAVATVIASGLRVIGVEPVEEMR